MSIPVDVQGLRTAIAERGGGAYLLTVSDDGSPHAVHVAVRWEGDTLAADVGRRTAANASIRPSVSLLFPLRTTDDYSLIVDGTAAVHERLVRVTPAKAILHRPAATPDRSASCESDCVPVLQMRPTFRR